MSAMNPNSPNADSTLNAGATVCGDLTLLIVQQMSALSAGQVLHVIAYDRGAAEDIPALCRMRQFILLYQVIPSDPIQLSHFYIQKG